MRILSSKFAAGLILASMCSVGSIAADMNEDRAIASPNNYVTVSRPGISFAPSGGVSWSENPSYLYERAYVNFSEGDFATASMLLRRILRTDESNAAANYLMGLTKAEQGNSRQAVRYLTIANRIFSNAPQSYAALGQAYVQNGQLDKARVVLAAVGELTTNCSSICASTSDIREAQHAIKTAMIMAR
ncbi:MAG: tetratricopeptide repeat protein [Maricaulaceae bacterium]